MQTRDHRSDFGRWRTAQRAADRRLRPYVHGYIASSSQIPIAVRERHLPSADVPIVVNFGAPHRRAGPAANGDTWQIRDGAWVVGPHDRPQFCEAVGERRFMVVRFTPLGAHLFLGLPLDLIVGQAVDLGEIDSNLTRIVMNRVGVAATWEERFAAMDALIAERVNEAAIPGAIAWVWEKLASSDGRIAVGSLASELDCSHRHLIAQFQSCIGMTPKSAARLLRFNHALRLMNKRALDRHAKSAGRPYIELPAPGSSRVAKFDWAGLAADCGYFDQAHFVKEFRRFADATPLSFLQQVADVD